MSDTGREIAIHPAPEEWSAYLTKLAKVVGYMEPVEIAVIAHSDMPTTVGVTDNPDGFLRISPGKVPLIVLRDNIGPTRWQFIVAHEFLHLLRWSVDRWVFEHLPEDEHEHYLRLVENTMKPLTILLLVGGIMNTEWVEDGVGE